MKQLITIPRIIGLILILFAAYLLLFSPQNIIYAGFMVAVGLVLILAPNKKVKEIITIPRIIGATTLSTALQTFTVLPYSVPLTVQIILLAIAGLVLILAPNKPAKEGFKELITSFKLKTEFALVMVYDWVFCAAITLLGYALYRMLMAVVQPLSQIPVAAGAKLGAENLEMYNNILGAFFTKAIIVLIAFWLLIVVAYTITRGLIWLTLLDKPLRAPFFARFSLLNLIWCTLFTIITAFVLIGKSASIFEAIVFILGIVAYTHLTTILHYSYTRKRLLGQAFKDAFGIGIGSLLHFAQQYCYILIVYAVLSQLMRLIPGTIQVAITLIIFFVFMAWYRVYMRNILRRIA